MSEGASLPNTKKKYVIDLEIGATMTTWLKNILELRMVFLQQANHLFAHSSLTMLKS